MRHVLPGFAALLAFAACHDRGSTSSTLTLSGGVDAPGSPAPSGSADRAGRPGAGESRMRYQQPSPDFTLPDLDGHPLRLNDLRGRIVVLEWFNPECPSVRRSHTSGPLKDAAKRWSARGVAWLSIDSGVRGQEGYGVTTARAGRATYAMDNPVLLDEGGEVAGAYGAKTTPTMYIIDSAGVIAYAGGIDNAPEGEPPADKPLINYVDDALGDIAAGRPVVIKEAPAYGCEVKYAR